MGDVNGDATLSAEEWIAAQKLVALEISDEIDEAWIDEGAFSAADTNGDGVVSREEFLEASFKMFEAVKRRTEDLLATLDRVVGAAHKLTAPCADNTVARIGPIEVEVSKNGPPGGKDKVIQFQWWNGEKWTAKKGPAKKKGKKK